MNKTVSIIVPVYNAENNLGQCIKDILNQTYPTIELILINDGSTDKSAHICKYYKEIDDRVHVIHQQNQGPSVARNAGIKVASGQYIQFVDADDQLKRNMTERLIEEMHLQTDLVICGYTAIQADNNHRKLYIPSIIGRYHQQAFYNQIGNLYQKTILPPLWNKLYRADIIKHHQLQFAEDIQMGEDLLFNLDYMACIQSVQLIQDPLYIYYLDNSNSLSQKFQQNMLKKQQMLQYTVKEFLLTHKSYTAENEQALQSTYVTSIINSLNNLFHPKANLSPTEIKEQITQIIMNPEIRDIIPYFTINLQARMIGKLLTSKSTNGIYALLKAKHFAKKRMRLSFHLLKKINGKG